MPQLLAVEWDNREARVVAGRARGGALTLDDAFAIPLRPRDDGGALSAAEIGAQLGGELARRGLARGEALAALGRANIEMRVLGVPPAPPEELPDLVRFQALRQFTTLGEDWPLDFAPLPQTASDVVTVLAAAVAPEVVEQARQTGAAAGLKFKRLVLRPFAAAALVVDRGRDERCRLLVDCLADEADLTVLRGEHVVLSRTVRLAGQDDSPERSRGLVAEIRRTIVAATNQLRGGNVAELILFGGAESSRPLRDQLAADLSLPVATLDPFSAADIAGNLSRSRPDRPGRFAPLVGMLRCEAAQTRPAIDFINPRRRPAPRSIRRLGALWGSFAATVAVAAAVMIWLQLAQLHGERARLQTSLTRLDREAAIAEETRRDAAELDKFAAGDVRWVDELRRLSQKLPPGKETQVSELQAVSLPGGGGRITFQGLADSSPTIARLEAALRDERHSVVGSGGQYDARENRLRWRFKEALTVAPLGGAAP